VVIEQECKEDMNKGLHQQMQEIKKKRYQEKPLVHTQSSLNKINAEIGAALK
jgi:hypothetical protein